MTDQINLSEEIPSQKYDSYSSAKPSHLNTLEEPIIDTIVPHC
jgi:hypothetical protein